MPVSCRDSPPLPSALRHLVGIDVAVVTFAFGEKNSGDLWVLIKMASRCPNSFTATPQCLCLRYIHARIVQWVRQKVQRFKFTFAACVCTFWVREMDGRHTLTRTHTDRRTAVASSYTELALPPHRLKSCVLCGREGGERRRRGQTGVTQASLREREAIFSFPRVSWRVTEENRGLDLTSSSFFPPRM